MNGDIRLFEGFMQSLECIAHTKRTGHSLDVNWPAVLLSQFKVQKQMEFLDVEMKARIHSCKTVDKIMIWEIFWVRTRPISAVCDF